MKTILVQVSDCDYEKLAGKTGTIDLKNLRKQILSDAFRQSLNGAVKAARKSGLSDMTLAEINAEIRAVRNQHE